MAEAEELNVSENESLSYCHSEAFPIPVIELNRQTFQGFPPRLPPSDRSYEITAASPAHNRDLTGQSYQEGDIYNRDLTGQSYQQTDIYNRDLTGQSYQEVDIYNRDLTGQSCLDSYIYNRDLTRQFYQGSDIYTRDLTGQSYQEGDIYRTEQNVHVPNASGQPHANESNQYLVKASRRISKKFVYFRTQKDCSEKDRITVSYSNDMKKVPKFMFMTEVPYRMGILEKEAPVIFVPEDEWKMYFRFKKSEEDQSRKSRGTMSDFTESAGEDVCSGYTEGKDQYLEREDSFSARSNLGRR